MLYLCSTFLTLFLFQIVMFSFYGYLLFRVSIFSSVKMTPFALPGHAGTDRYLLIDSVAKCLGQWFKFSLTAENY